MLRVRRANSGWAEMDPPDRISHGLFVSCPLVLYNTYQHPELSSHSTPCLSLWTMRRRGSRVALENLELGVQLSRFLLCALGIKHSSEPWVPELGVEMRTSRRADRMTQKHLFGALVGGHPSPLCPAEWPSVRQPEEQSVSVAFVSPGRYLSVVPTKKQTVPEPQFSLMKHGLYHITWGLRQNKIHLLGSICSFPTRGVPRLPWGSSAACVCRARGIALIWAISFVL